MINISRNSSRSLLAIAAVVGTVFLAFGSNPTAAKVTHMYSPNDFIVLGPLEPDSAIVGSSSLNYVFTPSRWGNAPQSGDWSLDWTGGGGLPAGHYEGKVYCLAKMISMQEDPFLIVASGHCELRSPGQGVIIQHIPLITTNQWCPTPTGNTPFRMEWHMQIHATGVYAGLSGSGTAVIKGLC